MCNFLWPGGEKFTKARSLEQLAKVVLGMNDMAKDSGPRMSDWRLWPLTQSQVEYAALDAILTNEIFWASPKEMQEPLGLEMEDDEVQIESAAEKRRSPESSVEHDKENPARKLMKSGSVNAKSNATNFYVMMRNKSIDPPNRGTKTRPQGSKESLKGKCFVVSGVYTVFWFHISCSRYQEKSHRFHQLYNQYYYWGRLAVALDQQWLKIRSQCWKIIPLDFNISRALTSPIQTFVLREVFIDILRWTCVLLCGSATRCLGLYEQEGV